ncbi:MAG: M48 family metallopeptidase [Pseudomonadota bacterium]
MSQPASLYDGVSARAHAVTVHAASGGLRLDGDGWGDDLPSSKLQTLSEESGRLRVGRTDIGGWSLVLNEPIDPAIIAILPKRQRYGGLIDRIGLVPAIIAGGLITAFVVAIGYVAPHWIAPHVPLSVERRMGSAVVGDFGPNRCRDANGQRALEALAERVSPGATRGPDGIKIAALDVGMFNAAALPGGYIVVFKPAITETNPEALAGILAHEIAHVRRRHVTEALIREMGIGALIRMFAGQTGANAEQLLDLSYTRADEAQADGDAIQMLRRANISPKPTAALFQGLDKEAPAYSAEFLQSHPLSARRAQRFAASYDPHSKYQPVLSREQADALFDICRRRQ